MSSLSEVLNFFDEYEFRNGDYIDRCVDDLPTSLLKDGDFIAIYQRAKDIRPLLSFSYYFLKRAKSLGLTPDEFLIRIEDYYEFKDYLREDKLEAFLQQLFVSKNKDYVFYHAFLYGYGEVRYGKYVVRGRDYIEHDIARAKYVMLSPAFDGVEIGDEYMHEFKFDLMSIPEFPAEISKVSDIIARSNKMKYLNNEKIDDFK